MNVKNINECEEYAPITSSKIGTHWQEWVRPSRNTKSPKVMKRTTQRNNSKALKDCEQAREGLTSTRTPLIMLKQCKALVKGQTAERRAKCGDARQALELR